MRNGKLILELFQEAFEVLGFDPEDEIGAYRITAGVCIFGSMTYKQKPRDEQADVDSVDSMKFILNFSVLYIKYNIIKLL